MRGDPGLDGVSVRTGWYPRELDSCLVWDAESALSPTDETPLGLLPVSGKGLAPSKVGDSISLSAPAGVQLSPALAAWALLLA